MPLGNSFKNSRKKTSAEQLLGNVSVASVPSSREISFTMLQAEQCAPEPKTISWRSADQSFQLQVVAKGGTPSWKLYEVHIDNPPSLKWTVVSEDPEQVYRLIQKRTNPEPGLVKQEQQHGDSANAISPGRLFLNRYQIENRIAHGGMGQIFRAKDLTMNRDVAIKVLHLHLAEEATAHRRFEREMQACLSLKHPNIVNVYDYGYTVEVTPYMVMEYLDGLTIEEYLLKKGHLTLLDFVQVFTQLCGAINQAHEKLIIHRDLKPSNIMLIAQPDGSLLAKLLDFGIAKGVGQTAVTNSNEVIGTVFYMSPEQCQNEVLDPRSDIYSLGCVMYEALSGLRPFHAGTPVATMLLHLNQEPASLREHDSSIPHSVEKLVFKALSKLPGERYQSASELLQALQLFHVEYSDLVRSTKLEVQGPMSMAASFETYSLEDTDEDSILIELCDKPMPITIQVLLVSKIIEEDDALAVVAFQQMHGGDAGQYLVELGCIDLSTYSLAVKCVETIKRFNLQIEQAASILQYCLSQNMNIEDALKVELVSSESC